MPSKDLENPIKHNEEINALISEAKSLNSESDSERLAAIIQKLKDTRKTLVADKQESEKKSLNYSNTLLISFLINNIIEFLNEKDLDAEYSLEFIVLTEEENHLASFKHFIEELKHKLSTDENFNPKDQKVTLADSTELLKLVHKGIKERHLISTFEAISVEKQMIEVADSLIVDVDQRISEVEIQQLDEYKEYLDLKLKLDSLSESTVIAVIDSDISNIEALKLILENKIAAFSELQTNIAKELIINAENAITQLSKKKEILEKSKDVDILENMLLSIQSTRENTAVNILTSFEDQIAKVEENIIDLEKDTNNNDLIKKWKTKVLEPSNLLLDEISIINFDKIDEVANLKTVADTFSVFVTTNTIFENKFKDKSTAKAEALAALDHLISAKNILNNLSTLSSSQLKLKEQYISNADILISTLTKEVHDFMPSIDELKKWVDLLMGVCNGSVPKEFNDKTFSTTNSLSDDVLSAYAKWNDLSTNRIKNKENKGVIISPEYKNWLELITANINFHNLYFEIMTPDRGINQGLLKAKADGGAFEYGPLRGGVTKVKVLTRFFGVSREYSSKPENKRLPSEKEDFIDMIRREGISYFHGNYKFIEFKNGEYSYKSKVSQDMTFFYGGMDRGYDELHSVVLNGSFQRNGITYYAVENSKIDRVLSGYSKQELNSGIKIDALDAESCKRIGLEDSGALFSVIPNEKKDLMIKDGKLDKEVLKYVFNMLRLSWLDLAYVKALAAGSSKAHGVGLELDGTKINMADLLSPIARALYSLNKEPVPMPIGRLLMLYRPEIYESEGGTHPGASKYVPLAVTEKAYDIFQHYLSQYSPGSLLGEKYKKIPLKKLKIKRGAKTFFRKMLDYVPEYNSSNDNERDGTFFHHDFNPNVGLEYDESVKNTEFPDLATAILRGYVDSVGNYYLAAAGFLNMTELIAQNIPDNITEHEIKERLGKVLSSYFGTYKIIKDGVNQEWIKKIYRFHTMHILRKYDKNTTNKFKRTTSAKAKSAVMELIIPIANATTVKGMTTIEEGQHTKYEKMKMDLILDMYSAKSIKNWEDKFDTPEKAREDFWETLKNGSHAEERIFNYVKSNEFQVHPRYFKSEREVAKLDYLQHKEKLENPGESKYEKFKRSLRHTFNDWGFSEGLEEPDSFKLADPKPPEASKQK
jgi:hypothetical protein